MTQPGYGDRYPDVALDRSEAGVLTVRLHADGGPAVLSERSHRDFPRLLRDVAEDRDNRVLVITGTGDRFMTEVRMVGERQSFKPAHWDEIYWEGRQVLRAYADLPMPVVAAINGPATIHSRLPGLRAPVGRGDGVQVVWEELLGVNRARYAALTEQRIADALRLGMVNEVLPPADVLPRALELAEQLDRPHTVRTSHMLQHV